MLEAVCTDDAEICLMYLVFCVLVFISIGNVYFHKEGRWRRNPIVESGF